jgi:hypothetical protein
MSFGEIRGGPIFQISADQDLLMKIGIAANGNVNIQSRNTAGRTKVRLLCKRCDTSEQIQDTAFLGRGNEIPDQVISFCSAHRHEGTLFESANKALAVFGKEQPVIQGPASEVGRRFREEEYDDNE